MQKEMETDREIGIIDWFIEVKATQNTGLPFGGYFFSDERFWGPCWVLPIEAHKRTAETLTLRRCAKETKPGP